jgi:hypothetical protein
MPARLIRDDMLESERVQKLPIEARWLFVAVMLSADDVGLLELSTFKLHRRAAIDQGVIPTLLQALCDADLLRSYQASGRTYGFIPRFRQRLQIKRTKCPMPPASLMADDQEAYSKINNLGSNPRLDNRDPPLRSGGQPCEPEVEVEVEGSKTSTDVLVPTRPAAERRREWAQDAESKSQEPPDCPHLQVLALWAERLPALPRHKPEQWKGARADHLRARWREQAAIRKWVTQADGLDWFGRLFKYIGDSPFLTGKAPPRDPGKAPFIAELEWVVMPSNFAKIVEGKYHRGI